MTSHRCRSPHIKRILGDLQKKKKKVTPVCEAGFPAFGLENGNKRGLQKVMTFFFFLEITPISCNVSKSTPVRRHPSLKPQPSVPLLTNQKLNRPKNFVSLQFAIRCPDFSFQKYGNPMIKTSSSNLSTKLL